ncbi:MAG: 50S ribosomal protein L3 [Oscillospiraceae bacterium]|jgi:large subunit ribosomal protein L3|nr:50S ribosomal protein L3 [Oscillospiraceae bacterium]
MQKAIIGRKAGMTQMFDEAGRVIPITVIQAGPCTVTQVRTAERDGYAAVQLGFEDAAARRMSKGERGHLEKAGVPLKKHLKEFALEGEYKAGDTVRADVFQPGDRVDITGTSKGKGYAGVIKRYGFHRTAASHGGGPVHRHQGSMGSATDASRVFPGKKMAGHMGSERVTVLNLDVVRVDAELGVIAVRGAVPGPRGGLVTIRNSVKNV